MFENSKNLERRIACAMPTYHGLALINAGPAKISGLESERWRATAPGMRATVACGNEIRRRPAPERAWFGSVENRVFGENERAGMRHFLAYRAIRLVLGLGVVMNRADVCRPRTDDWRGVPVDMPVRLDEYDLEQDRKKRRSEQYEAKYGASCMAQQ